MPISKETKHVHFTHVVVGTNDLERARAFYDAVLQTVGVKRVMNLTRHPLG